jgi:hypothetical protein
MGYFPLNGRPVLHVADIRSYHNELRDFATEFVLKEYVWINWRKNGQQTDVFPDYFKIQFIL